MTNWKPVAHSAIHHHLEMGAVMAESHGWQRPARYTSPEEELRQLRRTVGLFDISPSGKLIVQGSAVDYAISTVLPDTGPLQRGTVRVQLFGEVSDLQPVVLVRLADDEMIILTEPNEATMVSEAIVRQADRCVHVVDITSALSGVRIAGPSAPSLLACLTELDLAPQTFANMSCAQGRVAGVHGTVFRLDVGGNLNYDLYVGREFGEYMWSALLQAGEEFEVTPFGTEAMALL